MTYADFFTHIVDYYTGQAPSVMREIKRWVERKVPEPRLDDLWTWLVETQNPGRKIGVSDMLNGCNICTIKLIGTETPEVLTTELSRDEIAENLRKLNAIFKKLKGAKAV